MGIWFVNSNESILSEYTPIKKNYSVNYFLPEIKDELVGYIEFNLLDDFIRLLSTMRKRDFMMRDAKLVADSNPKYKALDLESVFNALFECSAIGNVEKQESRSIFSFKYRNRNASFNPSERIILHKGMWKSLNLTDWCICELILWKPFWRLKNKKTVLTTTKIKK